MTNTLRSGLLLVGLGIGFGAAALMSACSQPTRPEARDLAGAGSTKGADPGEPVVSPIDPGDTRAFSELMSGIAGKRVVLVGETHDRYDHHLNQLAVIRGLRELGVDLAVGMEFFQEPFQPYLNQYVAGEIGEKEMLKKTEYYGRWRYDYRLYRDILSYAQEQRIPLIALNAPGELVAKVSKDGLDALPAEDRERLPRDMVTADAGYEGRLRPFFEMHGKVSEEQFRRFVEVQTVWDEHMARVARDYLLANPGKTLVILAGAGHVVYPDAIPGRLGRMVAGEQVVVASGPSDRYSGARIDVFLAERSADLPAPGRIGVMLAGDEGKGVTISDLTPSSPAARAGLRRGDHVISIAGERVRGLDDVKLALLDRARGEQVWVEVKRGGASGGSKRLGRSVTLL